MDWSSLSATLAELLDNPSLIRGLLLFTTIFFIIGISIIPYLVGKIPYNYFLKNKRNWRESYTRYGFLFLLTTLLKNCFGVMLLLAGILMLFLPGQGLLTLFLGILLIDFPGKYKTERWLISQPAIANSLNWLRKRRNIRAIVIPD